MRNQPQRNARPASAQRSTTARTALSLRRLKLTNADVGVDAEHDGREEIGSDNGARIHVQLRIRHKQLQRMNARELELALILSLAPQRSLRLFSLLAWSISFNYNLFVSHILQLKFEFLATVLIKWAQDQGLNSKVTMDSECGKE